ncbi:MAG: sugar transferase [Akkermansiaceae bacterium]|nr:sugar transferase [Akkermansiaceae bacterium]
MSQSTVSAEANLQPAVENSTSHYNRLAAASFLVDAVVVWYGLILAYWLRFETSMADFGVRGPWPIGFADYLGHFVLGEVLMMAILTNFRLYDRQNFLSYQRTLRIVAQSAAVWLVAYLGLSLILKFQPSISRVYCGFGFVTTFVLLSAWRWWLNHLVRREPHASRLRQRTVVVGWSEEFAKAFRLFGSNTERQLDICGIVKPPGGELKGFDEEKRVRVIGRYEDLPALLHMRVCDVVLVADMNNSNQELVKLAQLCEKEMVDFKLVPTWFRVLLSGLHLESVGGMPVVGISKLPLHSALNQHLKRLVDIAGAIAGLALASPVIAVFGLLIYLESPGPILYRQRRLGQGGRLFDMIKLRSMRLDAEKGGSPGWTVKDDPRCLRVGKFMRRWNIDEVPQFWKRAARRRGHTAAPGAPLS